MRDWYNVLMSALPTLSLGSCERSDSGTVGPVAPKLTFSSASETCKAAVVARGVVPSRGMTSNVTFRKQQGAARSQCFFHGDGIKLIDLKRDILSQEGEKGKSTGSLDFDYEIKDENTNLGKCRRARAPTRRWTK